MTIRGLTRVPYYPELTVFCRSEVSNDCCAIVLSMLLFWHARDTHQRFNARKHAFQLARSLHLDPDKLKESLDYLASLKILDYEAVTFKTESEQEDKKEKTDEFYTLNFHNLYVALKERGFQIPVKILRHAADDSFDEYAYLAPQLLPVTQGLIGNINGELYSTAALNCARIICGICADPALDSFAEKALAPGWRMLVQPPATPQDIYVRWCREDERSIDIDLGDGSLFIPDGDVFGTSRHYIWHTRKPKEPRILAAALYLSFTALTPKMQFFSDLKPLELKEAVKILYRFTGLVAKFSDAYFDYLDLTGEEKDTAIRQLQEITGPKLTENTEIYDFTISQD